MVIESAGWGAYVLFQLIISLRTLYRIVIRPRGTSFMYAEERLGEWLRDGQERLNYQ